MPDVVYGRRHIRKTPIIARQRNSVGFAGSLRYRAAFEPFQMFVMVQKFIGALSFPSGNVCAGGFFCAKGQ